MSDDDVDVLARNLVIAVSRAVRLSMLHRLENDAIAATSQGLRDAVGEALGGAGGAVVKCGPDGVFVNGQLVRPIGEVVESAERLQRHFLRLGVETLAFDAVPDDDGVRRMLAAFQACGPGNARPLFALEVPGLRARAPGQGGPGASNDARAVVVGALVAVVAALEDLRLGRSRRTAPLRRALQRLATVVACDEGAVTGALCALDDDDRGAAVATLVLVSALRGGSGTKEAVALAFCAALALPHGTLDDVIAAAALPTPLAPALCALRLELWQSTQKSAAGFAAVVTAAEVAAAALSRGKSWQAVALALAEQQNRFVAADAAGIAALVA